VFQVSDFSSFLGLLADENTFYSAPCPRAATNEAPLSWRMMNTALGEVIFHKVRERRESENLLFHISRASSSNMNNNA